MAKKSTADGSEWKLRRKSRDQMTFEDNLRTSEALRSTLGVVKQNNEEAMSLRRTSAANAVQRVSEAQKMKEKHSLVLQLRAVTMECEKWTNGDEGNSPNVRKRITEMKALVSNRMVNLFDEINEKLSS